VDADEKRTLRRTHAQIMSVFAFLGKAPAAVAVNESGLYRLIKRADGAKAKPLRDWVAGCLAINPHSRGTEH